MCDGNIDEFKRFENLNILDSVHTCLCPYHSAQLLRAGGP